MAHIGFDLDNTIIDYDRVFAPVATEMGLIELDHQLTTKETVKARIISGHGGETNWMRLQGQVYGHHIARAVLYDGVEKCLQQLRKRGVRASIVSHKTRLGHFDSDQIDLWEAARGFLKQHGLFCKENFDLAPQDIHFEVSREDKIARITALGCDVFVDDLAEVLLDPAFPSDVVPIWFSGRTPRNVDHGLKHHASWHDILDTIVEFF